MQLKLAIAFGVGIFALVMLGICRSLGLLDLANRLFYGMAAFMYLIGLAVGTWAAAKPQRKTSAPSLRH